MRIALLTFEGPQSCFIIERLLRRRGSDVCGIVRSDVIIAGKSTLESASFLLRRTGFGFVARRAAEIFMSRSAARWQRLTRRPPTAPPLAEMAALHSIPMIGARDVNAPAVVAALRSWRPDLVVSVHLNQLIKGEIIALPPRGAINVHGGLLPRNRGLFPYFWALVNGDADAGVTIHWIDRKFDTGDILTSDSFPIEGDDTVHSLAWKTAELGADLLLEAAALIENGNAPRLAQDHTRAGYFSWPRSADVRRLKQRGRSYGSILDPWRRQRPGTATPMPSRRGETARPPACRPSSPRLE